MHSKSSLQAFSLTTIDLPSSLLEDEAAVLARLQTTSELDTRIMGFPVVNWVLQAEELA